MTKKHTPPLEDFEMWQAGYEEGIKEGRRQMQVTALSYLENRYANREIVRGSTLAKSILEVAADLSKYLKGLNTELKKKQPADHKSKRSAVEQIRAMSDEELRHQIKQRRRQSPNKEYKD